MALVETLRDRVVAPDVEPDVIDTAMLGVYVAVFDRAENRVVLRGPVAGQFVGDQHPGHVAQAFE
ncbi:MAG: hypothetical protein ACRDQU_01765 [Pseudonocardiaceae bacterium]